MDKLSEETEAKLLYNKDLTITLIIINSCLSYCLTSTNFKEITGILGITPFLAIGFLGYIYSYGLKNKKAKVAYVIISIISLMVIGFYWYFIQLRSAFKN